MKHVKKSFDVVVIGAGAAGLSAAIRLMQNAEKEKRKFSVAVIEKSKNIGGHILSGAIMGTEALNELFPDWKTRKAPVTNKIKKDKTIILSSNTVIPVPKTKKFSRQGKYIVSLGKLCNWLAKEAQKLGVEMFLSNTALDIICDENDFVTAIKTEQGDFCAKQVVIAEGAYGYIAQKVISKYQLDNKVYPQTYSLGFKEVWRVNEDFFQQGLVVDLFAKTLDKSHYGQGFIHHVEDNLVAVGFILSLDYKNPYLDPFMEFQNLKNNNHIKGLLQEADRVSFGAKIIPNGGYNSLYKLSFDGGVIVGDSAGFMDNATGEAVSNSMFSGIVAGDVIFEKIAKDKSEINYDEEIIKSSWFQELYKVRNIKFGFKYGLLAGISCMFLDCFFFKGKYGAKPKRKDSTNLKKAKKHYKINYPDDDGILTFNKTSSVNLTNINYKKSALNHLIMENDSSCFDKSFKTYDFPETKYCVADVFERVEDVDKKEVLLAVDFGNCINCKACEIKDPLQYIKWTPPLNGGGTNYKDM